MLCFLCEKEVFMSSSDSKFEITPYGLAHIECYVEFLKLKKALKEGKKA